MATAEAGLELPIGLTEQRFMQQLARIEARAIKSARSSQQAFVAANDNIGRSFGNMSRQSTAQLQNVSYQLQDIFVQISSGTSASRALGQQLPQLLSGFGAMGAVLGLVASAAIPLAANFLGAKDEAGKLDEAIKGLNSSLNAYFDAVESANVPTADLVEKYGLAAGAAQQLLQQLAQLSKLDAVSGVRSAVSAVAKELDDVTERVARYQQVLQQGYGPEDAAALRQVRAIKEEYGLTIDQAI